MHFSERVNRLELSRTAAVMQEAEALKAAGVDIIDFGPGEPDFSTPDIARQAAIEAVQQNFTRYTAVSGIKSLREAIARHLNKRAGGKLDASNIIVTCGAKQAIYNLCLALFGKDDEVLVPRPYWVTFPEAIRLSGAEPRFVDTVMDSGFMPRVSDLEAGTSERTRGLIVNYPHNPTGAMLTDVVLDEIAAFSRKHNLFLISDETYDSFYYGAPLAAGNSFLSRWSGSLDGLAVVGSFSKTYSMTGWRIGYAVGSPELIDKLSALQSHETGNPVSISQKAALAVLNEEPERLEERINEYRARRDLIVEGLNSLPGIECPCPEGAFYVFPEVRGLINSRGCSGSVDLAGELLRKARIAVVPGLAFGLEGHLRFSYATSRDSIRKGIDRLQRFCQGGR
jgi:aspartate aminotransferase